MTNQSSKSKREFSAGGVVYKKCKAQNAKRKIVWLVCKHSGYHKWTLPKGLVEKGERMKETALREVEEECGIKTKIIGKIPEPERYVYVMDGVKVFKQVTYFLMEYVSGDIKNHDWEMEAVEWLEFDKAKERLNFQGAKKVLEKAKRLLIERERQLKLI
jgi:8-oxo-dGTP pyrophosphatase MutT (NUDIX family)